MSELRGPVHPGAELEDEELERLRRYHEPLSDADWERFWMSGGKVVRIPPSARSFGRMRKAKPGKSSFEIEVTREEILRLAEYAKEDPSRELYYFRVTRTRFRRSRFRGFPWTWRLVLNVLEYSWVQDKRREYWYGRRAQGL